MARQIKLGRVFTALFLLVILFSAGRFFCVQKSDEEPTPVPAVKKETIKLGFIGPLSGFEQARGEAAKNGVALAIEEINDAGGVIGKNIEVIYKDGACNAAQATTSFTELVQEVSVVISVCDEETLAAALLADEKEVVLLSVGSSSPDITYAGEYVFRLWPSDDAEGRVIAEYLVKQERAKTAAVIFSNNDYGITLKNTFAKRFAEMGGNVTLEVVSGEETLETISEEVVFLADDMGINDTLNGTFLGKKVFGPERLAKKMTMSYAAYDLEDNAEYHAFLEKYEKTHDKTPYSYLAANAYDAGKIAAEALGNDGKRYLREIKNWQGASGSFTFDKHGDARREFLIKENNKTIAKIREGI